MISFVSKHVEMTEGLRYIVNFFFFCVDLCASVTAGAIRLFNIHTFIRENIQQIMKKTNLHSSVFGRQNLKI